MDAALVEAVFTKHSPTLAESAALLDAMPSPAHRLRLLTRRLTTRTEARARARVATPLPCARAPRKGRTRV